ncbi:MAG: hypothetical protein APR53_04840 [Methanoculleus sp. SDB]|nr:MAG: hypothetical protein APR53_04840 [Methanoculleus sp. SDB]
MAALSGPPPDSDRPENGSRSWIVSGMDSSTAALIATNIGVLVLALYQQWDIGTVIWIYWCQSVIIGFFQFFRILSLRHFTTDDIRVNNAPVEPTRKTQRRLAGFFAVHYGFFHFVYLVFLWMAVPLGPEALNLVFSGALLFFLNHALSFALNYRRDAERQQSLGRVVAIPYARIIPMHIAVVFSFLFLSGFGLVLFMMLKTAADTVMHIAEHAEW